MSQLLIVDDHGVVREGLRRLIGQVDGSYQVATAGSGNEALEMMANGYHPDLLLTDLHLGDMLGIELIAKASLYYPAVKSVLLTMDTNERYLSDAFRSGASGYILKEVDYDELLFGLKKVMEGRRFICTGLTGRLSERWVQGHHILKQKDANIELSDRESEILELISNGFTNLEIADKIFTSRRTVEGHRLSLLQKTGVRNTPELVKFAMLNGLLPTVIPD